MVYLPNELVTMVSKYVAKEDLPNFRLARRAYLDSSQDYFTSKCFKNIVTSINVVALDHLLSVVRHGEYGPAIKTITFHMNGVDEDFPLVKPQILDIVGSLRQRRQKISIKIIVTAMALPRSRLHDYGMARVFECMMSDAHSSNILSGAIKIWLPSPVTDYSISPARRHLAVAIARVAARHSVNINYTDSPGSILYNPFSRNLIMTGLKVQHIHELSGFLGYIIVRKLSITNTQVDHDAIGEIFWFQRRTLEELEFKDISLYIRGQGGEFGTASWIRLIEMMGYLTLVQRLELRNLRAGSVEPGMADVLEVGTVFAVGRLSVLYNIYSVLLRLETLARQ